MAFKSILNPKFKYRNADSTDVGKTFKRIRRAQKRQQRPACEEEPDAKVHLPGESTRRRLTR